ncbi:peptidase [Aquirhabdus parva]|uniref:Peptidase n=1 Tax=Aquirhabdus parva TaxID=2283318 RepID=A0A345P6Q5_9GAMM|nr:peptidase [Aquirhabdus parva]
MQIQTAKYWQNITKKDLTFIHKTILEAHPGVIDKQNPKFKEWLENGYIQAQRLIPQVKNQEEELAVLRFYTVGFQDGHVSIDPSTEQKKTAYWPGWLIEMQGNTSNASFIVKNVQINWPSPVPPNGSQILSCDGQSVKYHIEHDIAPFVDTRLTLESSWKKLANQVMIQSNDFPTLNQHSMQNCIVQLPDQSQKTFALLWQAADKGTLDQLLKPPKSIGLSNLGGGRYWINASNFLPNAEENLQFEKLLTDLTHLDSAKLVVFDVRGNTGGNSTFGGRMLSALLGNSGRLKDLSESAWWRVSKQAISSRDNVLSMMEKNYGKTSSLYIYTQHLQARLKHAEQRHIEWLKDGELEPDPTEDKKEGSDFQGQIILLTDSKCASACLDFADSVMSIPNAIQMGQETSADSIYNDIGWFRTPSGLYLMIPLKVFRERPRGNNQPYTPKYRFNGDISDTAAVQQWVLRSIQPINKN